MREAIQQWRMWLQEVGGTMIKILRDMWSSLDQSGRIAMMVLLLIAIILLVYWGFGGSLIGLL